MISPHWVLNLSRLSQTRIVVSSWHLKTFYFLSFVLTCNLYFYYFVLLYIYIVFLCVVVHVLVTPGLGIWFLRYITVLGHFHASFAYSVLYLFFCTMVLFCIFIHYQYILIFFKFIFFSCLLRKMLRVIMVQFKVMT